jgi:hypothetical protein
MMNKHGYYVILAALTVPGGFFVHLGAIAKIEHFVVPLMFGVGTFLLFAAAAFIRNYPVPKD